METRPESFHSTEMRAGNTDREDCASYLVEHHLEGRLSTEELERRQRAAHAAVTMSELRALFVDLPGDAAQRLGRRSSSPAGRSLERSSGRSAGRLRTNFWERVPRQHLWSATKTVVPPTTVILGGAAYSQGLWQYSSEAAFCGALFTGTLAYAAGVVTTHLRQRRTRRAPGTPVRGDDPSAR